MPEIIVRPYQSSDRRAVFHIAADTAFFGAPIEIFLDDRRLFCDAFYRYYTDFEPQHGWVADDGQTDVGFLMGCTDTRVHDEVFRKKILPGVVKDVLRGCYQLGTKTIRYSLTQMWAALSGNFAKVDLALYPAHLHINVVAATRGSGIGFRLMEAYLEQLRRLGLPGVHLHTTSQNTAAMRLYEKLGFTLLAARPTHAWKHLIDQPIDNLAYGLKLL